MSKPRFSDLLWGYEKKNRSSRSFASYEISGSLSPRMRSFVSMRIFKLARRMTSLLSHISAKIYGTAMLSFGLLTLILYFTGIYSSNELETPIIAIAAAIISIPFLLYDKSLPLLLQSFRATDYIFFEFFCIKRINRNDEARQFPVVAAVIIGILPALLGILIPIWLVAAAIAALIFIYVAFLSPEFSFFATFLMLPYMNLIPHSTTVLLALILTGTLSFIRKVCFGKRAIHIEQYDILLAIMLTMMLISGIFVKGIASFAWSVEMFFMALGYILANNIITNRRLADNAVIAIIISTVPPSVISVVKMISAVNLGTAKELSGVGIASTFMSGKAFAVFLVVSIVFAAAMIKQSHGGERVFYIFVTVLNASALILTGEFFAVLALILGFGAYYSLKTNKWTALLFPLLILVPYTVLLLPNEVLDPVFALIPSLLTVSRLLELWKTCFAVFTNNLFVGIGIGEESFTEELAKYGVHDFANSSNLFLEIGLEAGLLALIAFVLLLIVRLGHRAGYYPYTRNSQLSTLSPISAVCVFCLLAYGAMNYIWADMSAYYLFWCVFGIGSATLRVARKEYDDRVLYYNDTRALDSSEIDIEIE